MYDYMKALQRQFETKPRSIQNLSDEVDRTHKELSSRLVKDDRKLLLRLVDMEDSLRGLATLHSFICGYRRTSPRLRNSQRTGRGTGVLLRQRGRGTGLQQSAGP